MGVDLKKIREYFANLEDGSWAFLLLVLVGLVLLGFIDVWLNVNLSFLVVALAFGALARQKLQKSRPRDSLARMTGALRTSSFVSHPKFSGAVTTGLQSLGKRLWTPRWIVGALDITNEGLRWDPLEGHANFGFNSFFVPWSEVRRVVLRRQFRYYTEESSYVTLEGAFGPPIELRIEQFNKSRKHIESHGIPIVKCSAA